MNGYYPALTRILLSVIGPYDEAENKNPNSAFSMLKKAFYVELLRFPKLYESDPEKALQFLPRDVRYDAENVAFVKTYRLGEAITTELCKISNEPVSFEAVRRNANR